MARPGSLVITAFLVSRDVVNAGELYSNNAVCHQNHCVNPVFPALFDLDRLETLTWQCQPVAFIQKNMRFCQDVVDYDVGSASQIRRHCDSKCAGTGQQCFNDVFLPSSRAEYGRVGIQGREHFCHVF